MIVKIVLGIIFVPILLLNAIGPILIKKTQKLPARVKFRSHDEREFFLNRDEYFHALNNEIRNLGFNYLGSSFMEDSHTETHFSLYCNDKDSTCAMVVSMVSKVKTITYLEFSQVYSDGSMLDVSNANQVSPFPKMNIKIAARFPEIDNPSKLYEVFKKLKSSLKNSCQPTAYDKNKGFKMVEDFMAKESDILVEKGYCQEPIDRDGRRALTLKGAYLITWRSVFPGNKIRNMFDLSLSKSLLKNA